MKNMLSILIILGIAFTAFPQNRDPDKILDAVKAKFKKVQDYEVNVKIKVDVDFIKVPVTDAKIFYKQPDKIHVESERFAMLPREGMDFSPLSFLKDDYTAIYEREDIVDGCNVSIVKVIPLGEGGNIVLTTFWIDQAKDIVRKIETSTKTSGRYLIELKYDDNKSDYPLPSSMVFSFDVEQLNMPKGMSGDFNKEKQNKAKEKPKNGKVFITYSNYQVNRGISDNIFTEKKK